MVFQHVVAAGKEGIRVRLSSGSVNVVSQKLRRLAFLSLFFCASVRMAHAQNLVLNGSFENGNFTGVNRDGNAGSTQLPIGSTNLTGWTIGPTGSDVDWISNANTYGLSSEDGSRFVDLTGYQDALPYATFSQTINLVTGQAYTLSFWVGYESTSLYPAFNGPATVNVTAGNLNQFFTASTGTANSMDWDQFTTTFIAQASSTTLTFKGISSGGGGMIGLDNVSVTASAVEPSSMALLLPFSLGLSHWANRRRRNHAAHRQTLP